jgi:hypothetical protein
MTFKLPAIPLGGLYKMQVRGPGGELKHETPWFDNLITNAGLNSLGESVTPGRYCMVGTDNTAAATTNTTLGASLASKDGGTRSAGIDTGTPRFGWERVTYVFAQGDVVGNVAEVGVGWSPTLVFSRALVSPAISITALDQLTVVYELRMYVPTVNVTGAVTLDGISYGYEIAPIYAATGNNAGTYRGWTPDLLQRSAVSRIWCLWSGGIAEYGAFSYGPPCVLQDITEDFGLRQTLGGTLSPTGTNANASSVTNTGYTASSLECRFTTVFGIGSANDSGGIRGIIYAAMFGTYQCIFDATIPKDNTKQLSITWKQSWARRPSGTLASSLGALTLEATGTIV